MDIETLKHFQYIAKYRNITRAARHFYISQSTLSRQLMTLEEELGVTLFTRDNKKLELTEAGIVFSRECDLLIKHMETVVRKIQSAGKGKSGMLQIVTPGNISPILPQSLHMFKTVFPDAQLIIENYDFNEITSAILYDIYDVGFTYSFAAPNNDEIICEPIDEDDFSIVVSSKIKRELSTEAILNIVETLSLILPSYTKPPFIKLIMYELQKHVDIQNTNVIYLNNTDSVMLQVSMGLGYSIVPTSITKSKIANDQITFFPLTDFSAKSKIVMLYKKSNPSNLVTSFAKTVKKVCKTKT